MKANYKYNILCECLANQANYDVIIKENICKLGFFFNYGKFGDKSRFSEHNT